MQAVAGEDKGLYVGISVVDNLVAYQVGHKARRMLGTNVTILKFSDQNGSVPSMT